MVIFFLLFYLHNLFILSSSIFITQLLQRIDYNCVIVGCNILLHSSNVLASVFVSN